MVQALLIEDEQRIAELIKKGLEEQGLSVTIAYDGAMGKKLAIGNDYDIIILDVILPGMNGIDTAKAIMQSLPNCRIILFSGQAASVDLLAKARAEGYMFEVLPKPINPEKLLEKLKN